MFLNWMVGSWLSRDAAEVSQFLREDTSVISLTYFLLLNSSDRVKIAYWVIIFPVTLYANNFQWTKKMSICFSLFSLTCNQFLN